MQGRPRINLEMYEDEIVKLYRNSHNSTQIANRLEQNHDITVTARTIQRKLTEWQIINKRIKTEDTSLLRCRIPALHYHCGFNDVDALSVLHHEGYSLSHKALVRIRKELGIIRRLSVRDREEADEELKKNS